MIENVEYLGERKTFERMIILRNETSNKAETALQAAQDEDSLLPNFESVVKLIFDTDPDDVSKLRMNLCDTEKQM